MLDAEHWIKLIGSLVFVGILLAFFRWVLIKRIGLKSLGPLSEGLSLKSSLSLDPKRQLMVVSYEDSSYLLLLGPHTDLILPVSPHKKRKDPPYDSLLP